MIHAAPTFRRSAAWGAAIIFVVTFVWSAALSVGVPWSDDARFYVPASIQQVQWLEAVLQGDPVAASPKGIDRAFAQNREHPPVGKWLMGASWWLLHRQTQWLDDIAAIRAPQTLLFALVCATLFWWLCTTISPVAAAGGALALTALPRLAYHAHAETLDWPVSALGFLACVSLFATMERPRASTGWLSVLLFGLALGTKLNAPFFLVGALFYVWMLDSIKPAPRGERAVLLPKVPWVVVGWLVASPVVAFALWPWLWPDPVYRLNDYARYHLQHYGIYFYYRGVLYGDTPAPMSAPLVMLSITTPLTVLAGALVGSAPPLRVALGRVVGFGRWLPDARLALRQTPEARLGVFCLIMAATQLAAVSWPTVPKYGGIKLFLPAFPFLAALFGLGVARLERDLSVWWSGKRRLLAAAITAAVLLSPGWWGIFSTRGAWLSYYNELIGGLPGAVRAGFERQYYDLAYPEIPAALEQLFPTGGRLAILPNPKEYAYYLARWQRDGSLTGRWTIVSPERADVLLLTHERRWPDYPALVARYRDRPVLFEHRLHSVPLFSLLLLQPPQRDPSAPLLR